MAQLWEYKAEALSSVPNRLETSLNELAVQGWELIYLAPHYQYPDHLLTGVLKRELNP